MNRAFAIASLALAACKADLPELTDARGTFDTKCVGPYADLVLDTFPTSLDGSPALGAPDSTGVTLMANSVLTVGFIGLGGVTEASGADAHVVFTGSGMATVRVAGTDEQFVFAGNIDGTAADVDIAVALGVPVAVYIRIIGVSGEISVDAIQATHDVCK